ncbi:MAG: QueT transporter family protein [Thermoleophilia bacterium]|nr:QueT transporter family protein [Thermoleophilia bacterium]
MKLKTITRGGIIAAMYVVLTVTPGLNAVSFSGVQFRVSEMLMPLAAFDIAAIPGLWIGCMIANYIGSPFGWLDVTLGASLTLFSALIIHAVGSRWIGLSSLSAPVLLNAIGVAFIIMVASPAEDGILFWPTALSVGIGELGVMVVLAAPLFVMLKKNPELIGLEQRL